MFALAVATTFPTVENAERAFLKNHREHLNPVEGCPPDLLLRAAVLSMDEPILAHIGNCRHCTDIYMAALGSGWRPRYRRPDAPSVTLSGLRNWFPRLRVSVAAVGIWHHGLRTGTTGPGSE